MIKKVLPLVVMGMGAYEYDKKGIRKKAAKKKLSKGKCSKCGGKGCSHCSSKGYHSANTGDGTGAAQ